MKILVTGGAGFIGSRLDARLLDAGHEVVAVDDLSLGSREAIAPLQANPRFRFEPLDVCGPEFPKLMASVRPERVFHLAANSDISKSSADPSLDLSRSFLTTFHTLEAMRHAGTRELVFASTSAIYGDAPGALDEDHGPLAPISFYGAAKLSSEAYISAFCALKGMRAWVFRFPNVVGPNLTHGAVLDLVRKLHKSRTRLDVLGDGSQDKPYLHVDDLLSAIDLAVQHPAEPVATYNIAGEGSTTVREMAETIREVLQLPEAEIVYGTGNRGWPGDVPKFEYDTRKIRALGWRPLRNSREAVRAAIEAEALKCKRSS
ncbi:MAG: NAD-dependent epimerase/dehydratase family protein [Deltaproteobacteria bacterium]|nr:NAD-dependent epimerase/dehydratase family protein [Deltaproteobacteria bacterium]